MAVSEPPATSRGGVNGSRLRRWLLAGAGLALVGLGILGALLPVLPTTVFLIGAAWCFARSCPWLSEKVLGLRIFRGARPWLTPGEQISTRARVGAVVLMWIAIAVSAVLTARSGGAGPFVAGTLVALGLVGTWFIARFRR
jgi:uncharacterized membrane protein YbaN (DUF454 family)